MLTSFPTGVGFGLALDRAAREIGNGTGAFELAGVWSGLIDFLAKFSAGDIVRLSITVIILVAFHYALTQPISK
jgi:hypothetical protein